MVAARSESPSRWVTIWTSFVGGLAGGLAGGGAAVFVTQLIKGLLDWTLQQDEWLLVTLPPFGVLLAVLVLHGVARGEAVQRLLPDKPAGRLSLGSLSRWYVFPRDVARADLTADVVATAGKEERFPWWLAPIRAVAILATVGLGAPMGTEAPAAHLGVAAGSWLGTRPRMQRLARLAGVSGGAAGVAALMGIPLVGVAFMLELGRRRSVPVSAPRFVAVLAGGARWVGDERGVPSRPHPTRRAEGPTGRSGRRASSRPLHRWDRGCSHVSHRGCDLQGSGMAGQAGDSPGSRRPRDGRRRGGGRVDRRAGGRGRAGRSDHHVGRDDGSDGADAAGGRASPCDDDDRRRRRRRVRWRVRAVPCDRGHHGPGVRCALRRGSGSRGSRRCRGRDRGWLSPSGHRDHDGARRRRALCRDADVPRHRRCRHALWGRFRARNDATHERRQGAVASPRGAAFVARGAHGRT